MVFVFKMYMVEWEREVSCDKYCDGRCREKEGIFLGG